MTETRGQIVTFYSYKGGTGRTMALANVAWILAANGKRVLVADWDLESPGMHRFFAPFIDAAALDGTGGVIDLIREFEWAANQPGSRPERWYEQYARVHKYAFTIDYTFAGGGSIDFLPAGKQTQEYIASLTGMDWDRFYLNLRGGEYLDALRADMKSNYDYALIDSRTGLSDVQDICTVHLPDTLVDCFTFSEQGVDGAARLAHTLQTEYRKRRIRILPVPMRVDPAEHDKAAAGRALSRKRFTGFPAEMTDTQRQKYWGAVEVPYVAFYAYEEVLATFGDDPEVRHSLLPAYEALTGYLTNGDVTEMPALDSAERTRVLARFTRQVDAVEYLVSLRYAAEDQAWAEWVEDVLTSSGVRVVDTALSAALGNGTATSTARQLTLVSAANAAEEASMRSHSGSTGPLVAYVADVSRLPGIPMSSSAMLHGASAEVARDLLLRLVGLPPLPAGAARERVGARYPGTEPEVFNAPARNPAFTGREDDIVQLRSQLRIRGTAVVVPKTLPVALYGLGGIGKSQIAIEYVHRFKNAYDIIWWLPSEDPNLIDARLIDLGVELNLQRPVPTPDAYKPVLQHLEKGGDQLRWLLVFDNAEDVERIAEFLPRSGAGHVLITSRDPGWGDRALAIEVDVFTRGESLAYLRRRAGTSIRREDAEAVADHLGDLPIALAAAGAWLADTGIPPADFLRQLQEGRAPGMNSVTVNWNLALTNLHKRSPAAFQLLQCCAHLAPEISLDLVYSEEMARSLVPLEPRMSDRVERGSMVQTLSKLALIKLDAPNRQIVVHRVLQAVVRERMTPEENAQARAQVGQVLAKSRPPGEVEDPGSWDGFRKLWPHLEVSGAITSTDEDVRQLMIDRLRYVWARGGLPQALEFGQQVDEAWTDMLATATDRRQTEDLRRQLLHLRFNIANVLRDQAAFTAARELDEATLREQEQTLGPRHAHTLATAGGLAADLRALGLYQQALNQDRKTHPAWAETFGDDHPRTLAALNNLAASERLMGNIRGALALAQQAYERDRAVLGEQHPLTLGAASNLGRDMRDAGDYERSVTHLEQVLAAYEVVDLGSPGTRATFNTQVNLGVSLRSAGRADDAAPLLDRAYELLNNSLGESSPHTLGARLSRSMNFLAQGDLPRARRDIDAVYRAYERSLGADHPLTLACLNNQAVVDRAAREHGESRKRAADAAERLRAKFGSDHPHVLAATTNLAIATAEGGDAASALPLFEDVSRRSEASLGASHPDSLRAQANLALVRTALGQPSEPSEREVLEVLIERLGETHPVISALRGHHYLHRVLDPHPF